MDWRHGESMGYLQMKATSEKLEAWSNMWSVFLLACCLRPVATLFELRFRWFLWLRYGCKRTYGFLLIRNRDLALSIKKRWKQHLDLNQLDSRLLIRRHKSFLQISAIPVVNSHVLGFVSTRF
jgi:hypothetical protein